MITIDDAIKELSDRMELWEDYGGKHGEDAAAREWLDVLQMCKEALEREKGNAEYLKTIRGQLATLKDDDKLTVRLFQEILSGIKIREAPQDDTTGG